MHVYETALQLDVNWKRTDVGICSLALERKKDRDERNGLFPARELLTTIIAAKESCPKVLYAYVYVVYANETCGHTHAFSFLGPRFESLRPSLLADGNKIILTIYSGAEKDRGGPTYVHTYLVVHLQFI